MDCPHGFANPASCIDCMEDGNIPTSVKALPAIDLEYTFTARYNGQCSECNLGIHVGQTCIKLTTGRVIHLACHPVDPWGTS